MFGYVFDGCGEAVALFVKLFLCFFEDIKVDFLGFCFDIGFKDLLCFDLLDFGVDAVPSKSTSGSIEVPNAPGW